MLGIVGGVALPIMDDDLAEIERRCAFQAGDVDAELARIRSAFVMDVDAADAAEMMLGDAGVESVGRELVRALRDAEMLGRRGYRDPNTDRHQPHDSEQ